MKPFFHYVTVAVVSASCILAFPRANAADAPRSREELEAATRLQVFLDRAEFAPGKIDGRYGEFTLKALSLYRQAKGGSSVSVSAESKKNIAPDVSDLDLNSVDPLFVSYTVTDADMQSVGELPESIPAQSKKKSLPYKNVGEAIAEMFHTDADFLAQLNPDKIKAIKAGDTLIVPNVEPFDLSAVKNLKPGGEIAGTAVNDSEDETSGKNAGAEESVADKVGKSDAAQISVKIETETNMLTVYEQEKLVAAYPVTIGSERTESPVGEWKVRGVAKMPNFRYDKAMLNKGERSEDFHMLPPGPNNPVGVIWIALNKKGIGLHGTSDPDAIGRSASHGCVRMANWDVVRLAGKVKAGVSVSIR